LISKTHILRQAIPAVIAICVAIALAVATQSTLACPQCKNAVPTQAQTDYSADGGTLAPSAGQGYNYSIIFMMAMPFILAGSFAGGIYLTVRRTAPQAGPS